MINNISEIADSDTRGQQQFDSLLRRTGIKRDNSLDYIAGIYDENYTLIASGACFRNTLRCLSVDEKYQGAGLMAPIVTHLLEYQVARGNQHLFLYTKCNNSSVFSALGFYEIARVDNEVVLMENIKNGFRNFLENLRAQKKPGKTAVLVMNCNPPTLGHRYLLERASKENDNVHIFVVSEDMSIFSFAERYKLVEESCADLLNITLHTTESYMISSAVFPSYFLKDEAAVTQTQAKLDVEIFKHIAQALDADVRYLGEEPLSFATGIYNKIILESLLGSNIECIIIPRIERDGMPISASRVRKLLQENRIDDCKELVTPSTFRYFFTEDGKKTIKKIQEAKNVINN